MTLLRTLSIALLAGLVLSLAACGGGTGGGDDFGSNTGFDPASQAPDITVVNGASSTTIKHIYAYESYTGETLFYENVYLPAGSATSLLGLNVSQYDIYVEFVNGHRSYDGTTDTNDPYNGTSIFRRLPRVNPGEEAVVEIEY